MDLQGFIEKVADTLRRILTVDYAETQIEEMRVKNPLSDGLYYAVGDGGKRIRPSAVYLGALASGREFSDEEEEKLVRIACAIELIHSYSLVHDDLPAMDDDTVRRGKPAVHVKYGEGNGILIGDELLTLSSLVMLEEKNPNSDYACACRTLVKAASDMAIGQTYDLDENDDDFLRTYALKTSALLSASFKAGAIITCGENSAEANAMGEYGFHVGQAFQIADDLLENHEERSYVSAVGREVGFATLNDETEKAIQSVRGLCSADTLEKFANELKNRKR